MFEWCRNIRENETFSDLWRDDFLQATARVSCHSLQHLELESYSWAVFKRGLKARSMEQDGEENMTLDRAMEYARVVRVELADMLVSVNSKVKALEP